MEQQQRGPWLNTPLLDEDGDDDAGDYMSDWKGADERSGWSSSSAGQHPSGDSSEGRGYGRLSLEDTGDDDEEHDEEDDDDDEEVDEAMRLPLVASGAKLNLYTPQINLENLTAGCSRWLLVLIYLLFFICIVLTIESLVMGNTDVIFEEVICDGGSSRVGTSTSISNSTSECTLVSPPTPWAYAAQWSGNVSGCVNLIGTISLTAKLGATTDDSNTHDGGGDNLTTITSTTLSPPPPCPWVCLANQSSFPALVSLDIHVVGCTLANPAACFTTPGTRQWQEVLSLTGQTRILQPKDDSSSSSSTSPPSATSSSPMVITMPIFTSIYQNQEVLRNFGSISAYKLQVTLYSDSVDLSHCPVSMSFSYQHAYALMVFRVLETIMILINIITIPIWTVWLYSRPTARPDKEVEGQQLPQQQQQPAVMILERHWLTLFLFGLLAYQDPIYAFGQWVPQEQLSVTTKFISQVCVSLGMSIIFVVWLLFVDGFRRRQRIRVLPKLLIGVLFMVGCVGMATLSFPSLLSPSSPSPLLSVNNWGEGLTRAFLAYSVIFLLAFCLWLAYFIYLVVKAGVELRRMNYLQTRYLQLSFRFFFLQSVLVALAYSIVYGVTIVRDLVRNSGGGQRGGSFDDNSFINHTNALLVPQTQPFGKLLFIWIYIYILLYLHLPVRQSVTTPIITTYYVTWEHEYDQLKAQFQALVRRRRGGGRRRRRGRRRSRVTASRGTTSTAQRDAARGGLSIGGVPPYLLEVLLKRPLREVRRRLLPHHSLLPPIFCVETARLLLNLANQVYYDLPSKPTPGGWGVMDVDQYGYQLLGVVCEIDFDTYVMVAQHKVDGRIVVCFRGSSSKKQWLNNLRFQQCELDFSKLPELNFHESSSSSKDDNSTNQFFHSTSSPVTIPAAPLQQQQQQQPALKPVHGGVSVGADKRPPPMPGVREEDDDEEEAVAELEGRANPVLHPNRLTEAVATGAELIQQTGDLVVEGVLGTAHLLGVDRLPLVRRLLRGHVHQGFWEAYLPVREQLAQLVYRSLLKRHGKVWVCGHSQGGALATFAALDLAINTLPKVDMALDMANSSRRTSRSSTNCNNNNNHHHTRQQEERAVVGRTEIGVYSFGSPRVMNHALAAKFNKLVPHCFRVVTDGDAVTGVPTWYYKHVGTEVVIDGQGSGSLVIDPSFMERRLRTRTKNQLKFHMLTFYERALSGALEAAARTQSVEHNLDENR